MTTTTYIMSGSGHWKYLAAVYSYRGTRPLFSLETTVVYSRRSLIQWLNVSPPLLSVLPHDEPFSTPKRYRLIIK